MKTSVDSTCSALAEIVKQALTPLIPGDYLLLDLPYYANIGDILIWRGTEDFLKDLPGKCLGRHSKETFDFRPIPQDCTILLLGGGNFGDIWREHQEFRLEVIRLYPENPIIVLPQTIYYESEDIFSEDVKIMNKHQHLTICARDNHSAEQLRQKEYLGQLLTLPDMAFCINRRKLQADMTEATSQKLFLLREDKELKVSSSFTISDWPQMQESGSEAWQHLMTHKEDESDSFFINKFFPQQIKTGVKFASSFKEAYSTRLHFAILRILLNLPVKMLDNSYGKNLDFYNTWLKDSEQVDLPDEKEQSTIELATFFHKQKLECIQKYKIKYDEQIIELKREHREQEIHNSEIIRQLEENIKQQEEKTKQQEEKTKQQEEKTRKYQNEASFEFQKHKKYKRLFNITLLLLSFFCIIQAIALVLKISI